MAALLLVPMPFPGHVNPALRVAAALRAQGHRVRFLTLLGFEGPIRAAGFEVDVRFEGTIPAGTLSDFAARFPRTHGWRRIVLVRALTRRINQLLQGLVDGELDGALASFAPDLVLCDALLPLIALVARGKGYPTAWLNPMLLPATNPAPPPPRGAGAALRRFLGPWVERVLTALLLNPRYQRAAERLARKHDFPFGHTPPYFDPRQLPELMLYPRALADDHERANGNLRHLGPCIPLDRPEPAFPFDRLSDGKPLVLFSLGTVPFQSPHAGPLFQMAVAAAAKRPEWQFVLAVSDAFDPAPFDGAAPNVIAQRQIPQLQLLPRAAALITHGGLGTVKEGIYFGVPMVVIPLLADQPMVARRVAEHGLGLELRPPEATPERLLALLDRLVGEPSFRQAVGAMKERFREAEDPAALAREVERLLPAATPAAAPRAL